MKAFLPPAGKQPMLAANAAATQQLARLLDALLILDVEGSCEIAVLAERVGVKPERLRELLSSFMIAGSEAIGPDAPFSLVFGTHAGPSDTDESGDADQAAADHVFRASTLRDERVSLVDDVGRKPVTIDQVAVALLAAETLMAGDELIERHRDAVAGLIAKLSNAMTLTLAAPVDPEVQRLREAADRRQRVTFTYADAEQGVSREVAVDPYDVRRRRDSYLLDAGPDVAEGWVSYDISCITNLQLIGPTGAFVKPALPPADARDQPTEVVLQVPIDSPIHNRLRDGWRARAVARSGDMVNLMIDVDRPAAWRLGVLVLQLGPTCSVVSPESFQLAPAAIAARVLAVHNSA